MTKRLSWITLLVFGSILVASDAGAIVGRPATPMSGAGVARRSVRRTAVIMGSAASTQTPTAGDHDLSVGHRG
jgi:hypothetical protein